MSSADSALDHEHDHVTPYDRLAFSDEQAEQLLVTGNHSRELIAFFGEAEYRYLTRLARKAHQVPLAPDAPRVFIVPGIMGSQLGRARRAPLPNDVLWIDPVDIQTGRLTMLRMPEGSTANPIISLGIVLHTYLRLKLQLRLAGFAPYCHHYDWRLDIAHLGRQLAERVQAEKHSPVMIVAHSMGGLVARAAAAHLDTQSVQRIVLLGTPNRGSFAVVQALRGTYAVVRKIARLAHAHSAEALAAEVFSTFPSLYQLMPANSVSGNLDLLDPEHWPSSGPSPRAELMAKARSFDRVLAGPDERFAVIVGVGQETVTRVARRNDDFVYTITRAGDGTVPAVCAGLSGASTYYTKVAHSELTRDDGVAGAIVDILRKGSTRRLDADWRSSALAEARISDRQLRSTHTAKVDWIHLTPEERRIFLQTLNEPPKLRLRVPKSRAKARH